MLIKGNVLTNHIVYHSFHLTNFLVGHLLEVREVETEGIGRYQRTLLLHMVAQHLFQSIVEQVGSCMVGSTCISFVCIYTGHKLGRRILRQLFDDMDALVVLTLGIDDIDGLSLIDEDTTVTNLTTHLTIEWGIVEHKLIELVLLLCHLAIAQDMALIFRIVITHELLLALSDFHPV